MFDHAPVFEASEIPPLKKLFDFLSSLPKKDGEEAIQGQVQIKITNTDTYQDSAVYGLKFDGETLSFRAVNAEGKLIEYKSVDGSIDTFVDQEGKEYFVNFPGFEA